MLGIEASRSERGARLAVVAVVALVASLGGASASTAPAMSIGSFTASRLRRRWRAGTPTSRPRSGSRTRTRRTTSVASRQRLPPGLIGNPRAVASCTMAQLTADTCPAGSKIGTTSTIAKPDLPLVPALTATGDVYNVAPVGSEPARIGLVVRPVPGPISLGKFSLAGVASVRVPGDFGLNVRFDNLPRTLQLVGGAAVGVQVQGLDLTLNGIVGVAGVHDKPHELSPGADHAQQPPPMRWPPRCRARRRRFTPDRLRATFHLTRSPRFAFAESNYRADYPSNGRWPACSCPGTELPARSVSHQGQHDGPAAGSGHQHGPPALR